MRVLGVALSATLAIVLWGCRESPADATESAPATAADETPTLVVKPLHSAAELLAAVKELHGKTVLVNIWATWCGECREEFPHLVEVRDKYAERGLVFMPVSGDLKENIESKVVPFLIAHGVKDHAYWLDLEDDSKFYGEIHPKWQGEYPATFLFNTAGELVEYLPERQSREAIEEAVLRHLPP